MVGLEYTVVKTNLELTSILRKQNQEKYKIKRTEEKVEHGHHIKEFKANKVNQTYFL